MTYPSTTMRWFVDERQWQATLVGELVVVVKGLEPWTNESLAAFVELTNREVTARVRPAGLLVHSSVARALSSHQRGIVMERAGRLLEPLRCGVLISDSAIVRMASKSFFWLRRAAGSRGEFMSYGSKQEGDALAWLHARCSFDVALARKALAEMYRAAQLPAHDVHDATPP